MCSLCINQISPINMQGFGSMKNILMNFKFICASLLHIINDPDSLIIMFPSAHLPLHTPNQEQAFFFIFKKIKGANIKA